MAVQRNLFSGEKSPVPFALSDITALLPCEESEFTFGYISNPRAALPGSHAAIQNPELVNCQTRSLFATLIQAHSLWGRVARGACIEEQRPTRATSSIWETASEYSLLESSLTRREAGLSKSHR